VTIGAAPAQIVSYRFNWLVFLIFLGAIWSVNYPGRLNIDSTEQLIGAAFPVHRNDWHAPIVGWLWNIPAPLLGQPAAALLVQSILIAFGAAIVPARRPTDGWTAMALILELCWKTALIPLAGVILKEVLLVGALLGALGCFQLWITSGHRLWLWAGAALIVMSALVRAPNAIMFCIAAALALPLFSQGWKSYAKRLLLACTALLACVPLSGIANRYFFHAKPAHPEAQIVIFDVAGTSIRSGTNLFEAIPGWPTAPVPELRGCYDSALWDNFAPWGRCRSYSFAARSALVHAGAPRIAQWWLGELASHPLAYSQHRLSYLGNALASGIVDPVATYTGDAAVNGAAQRDLMRRAAAGRVEPSHFTLWREDQMPWALAVLLLAFFCLPYTAALALAVCISLLATSLYHMRRRGRANALVIVPAAVGIGNVVMMLFFGAASSPRYFFPLILGAYLASTHLLRLRSLQSEVNAET
jgi:hypothetical protein